MNASSRATMINSSDRPSRSGSFPFGGRRTWLALAGIALVGGAALNWSWLVAVGVAPLLLALAPCAAMCALGLCMKSTGGGCKRQAAPESRMSGPVSVDPADPDRTQHPAKITPRTSEIKT